MDIGPYEIVNTILSYERGFDTLLIDKQTPKQTTLNNVNLVGIHL
jgi:hypothetical protein